MPLSSHVTVLMCGLESGGVLANKLSIMKCKLKCLHCNTVNLKSLSFGKVKVLLICSNYHVYCSFHLAQIILQSHCHSHHWLIVYSLKNFFATSQQIKKKQHDSYYSMTADCMFSVTKVSITFLMLISHIVEMVTHSYYCQYFPRSQKVYEAT